MAILCPPCPVCDKAVPFKRTQWGLGEPFSCEECGSKLVIPRNIWVGLGPLIVFLALKDRVSSTSEFAILAIAFAISVFLLSRIFVVPQSIS